MSKRKKHSQYGRVLDNMSAVFEESRKSLGRTSVQHILDAAGRVHNADVVSMMKEKYEDMETEPHGLSCARYDYTLKKTRLREKGTEKYLPFAMDKLSDVMPRNEIREFIYHVNSLIMNGGYDDHDSRHVITLGAAIWILDQLTIQEKMDEAQEILLSVDMPGTFLDIPFVVHPAYKISLIEMMTLLLIHRNDGLYEKGEIETPLADEWTLTPVDKRPDASDKPLRMAFESIMALLDDKAVSEAVKEYEKKIWEFYRLSCATETACQKGLRRRQQEIDRIDKEIDALYKDPDSISLVPVNPLLVKPEEISLSTGLFTPAFRQTLDTLLAKKRKQEKEKNRIDFIISALTTSLSLTNDREKYARMLKGVIPDSLAEELIHFSVRDPYETCFALLWLLDSGSMLPWAYYGSLSVIKTAKDQLPFNAMMCVSGLDRPVLSVSDSYQHQFSYHQKENMLDGDNQTVEREFGMNLSQVLYRCTNAVLPRLTCKTDMEQMVALLKLETEKENELFSLLVDVLNASYLSPASPERESLQSQDQTEKEENAADSEDMSKEQMIAEIDRLKEAVKQERKSRHELHLENKKLLRDKEQANDALAQVRKEVHDLRTIVFLNQNDMPAEEAAAEFDFPMIFPKKIVSFGGHASWLNHIRKLLPNVRFIAPDMQPNEELVRNADEIWIQPNCLSHADFYKIINVVRSYNLPVRYFGYSGAERCAVQLAESLNT